MTRWKLRTRVALAAAAAVLVGVIGLGVGVQFSLDQVLHRQLDRTLKLRAADIDELAEKHPGVIRGSWIEADPASSGTDAEVIGADGRPRVLSHPALGPAGLSIAQSVAARHVARFATIREHGVTYRLYAQPLESGGAVAVIASTDATDDALARARRMTAISAVAAALLAVVACILLTDRALRPLRRLNSEVGGIRRTADPSQRVTAPRSGDEIEQLAGALNAMLEALQRAREVERSFLADASHEMRTPLTALRGNAAYLARHGGDAEAFHDLESDMERLARLLDQLLAVAREDSAPAPSQPVPVAELLDRVSTDPQVRITADPDLTVQADPDSLARALLNLIDNAKRYGPPGAPIEVRADRDGAEAVLSVTDAGRGLDDTTVDQAATRFWRGANSTGIEGSGLGLGLVRATAQRHGGTLEVEGARFAIRLPALDPVEAGR